MERFKTGQTVLVREMWRGRVWSARPEIVVQDTPELLALFLPQGTLTKNPSTPAGSRVTPESRATDQWRLTDLLWSYNIGRLRLTIPGEPYSVIAFWNDDRAQRSWYINLEDPLTRNPRGFDYMDQMLDAIVSTNLQEWHWKDADEVDQAVAMALISAEKKRQLYAEGERVVKMLLSGKSIFNGWANWKPDPAWKAPVLPVGWDAV